MNGSNNVESIYVRSEDIIKFLNLIDLIDKSINIEIEYNNTINVNVLRNFINRIPRKNIGIYYKPSSESDVDKDIENILKLLI